jgi:sulfite oxidase
VLAVRAWDEAGQTQPSRTDETWNYKGYLCNAWHRVPISVA